MCRGEGAGAAGLRGMLGAREPQAGMMRLPRRGCRVGSRVVSEDDRRGGHTGRNREGLLAEYADECAAAAAIAVCLNIALIPGQPERRSRDLDDKQVEVGIFRQVPDFDAELLIVPLLARSLRFRRLSARKWTTMRPV